MIRNEAELSAMLSTYLQMAVDNTLQIALDKLLDIIEKEVYSYNATWTNGYNGEPGRTHEFYESWSKTKASLKKSFAGTAVEGSILQELPLQWHEPFSHGSIVEGGTIQNNQLNQIINEGLKESHLNFPAIEARPFWDEFEKWCNKNLIDTFKTECSKVGIDLSTVHGSFTI